jgi:hypothetical protein
MVVARALMVLLEMKRLQHRGERLTDGHRVTAAAVFPPCRRGSVPLDRAARVLLPQESRRTTLGLCSWELLREAISNGLIYFGYPYASIFVGMRTSYDLG